jgi:hypothetical protein
MKKSLVNESLVKNSSQNSKVSESIIDSGIEKNENFISSKSKTNEPKIGCGVDVSKIEKSFIITEDQIRSLYFEFTSSNANEEKLIIVKDKVEFWYEFEAAKEDYYYGNDDDFKREYDELTNSCKEDEIVVYQYIPFSFQQMLESVEEKINIYCQQNDDACTCGIDSELSNLYLLCNIISQNI